MSTRCGIQADTQTTPNIEKRKVTPRRLPTKELRKREELWKREYMVFGEIARLLADGKRRTTWAARSNAANARLPA